MRKWMVLVMVLAAYGTLAGGGIALAQAEEKLAVTRELVYTVPDGAAAVERRFVTAGEHWALVCRRGTKLFVVHDGHGQEAYDDVSEVTLARDGRRVAYVAERQGKSFAVVDGGEAKPYDYVYSPTFSPDGRRFAYQAESASRELVVLDGREQKPYDEVRGSTLAFSTDSEHFAYVAELQEECLLVLDGDEHRGLGQIVDVWQASEAPPGFVWYTWSGQMSYDERGNHLWQPDSKLYRFTAR